MSNYNIQISWSGKDSLSDSDPLKVISGTDFQTEFEAVRTAINSKAEAADLLALVYPVGSIYFNATNSNNPSSLLGFGTWAAFGAGRVLVGFDSSDSDFDTAEETGGSKDAINVSHTHTATVTDPGHSHLWGGPVVNTKAAGATQFNGSGDSAFNTSTSTTGISVGISTEGSSGTGANLQPYITVYMWKRTA